MDVNRFHQIMTGYTMKGRNAMRLIRLLTILVLMVVLGACGGGGSSGSITTPVPGGSATTTLTITKTNLYSTTSAPASTTVRAVFVSNGVPIANLPVTFSATPGLVTFSPADGVVTTDVNGTATVVMTGLPTTGVGQVKVSATVNGALVEQYAPFYLNSPSLHLANMSFNPTSLTVGGSTTVSFDVLDSDGNLYTQQDLEIYMNNSSGWGAFVVDNPINKVRSSGGRVAVTYATAAGGLTNPVSDTITATLGSSILTKTITINPLSAANISYLYQLPVSTSVDYNGSTSFVFQVTDVNGTGLPNQNVDFTISGTSAGSTLQASSAVTDQSGRVTAVLKAGTTATTLWVTATLRGVGVASQSAVITIGPKTVGQITSSTAADTLAFGGSKTISFNVKDANGSNLPNQLVSFSVVDIAGITSTNATLKNTSGFTDSSGNVSVILNAKAVPSVVRVKATSGSTNGYSNNMTISSGTATLLTIATTDVNITTWSSLDNGATKSLINPTAETGVTITAKDALGNAVVGLLVNVATTGGAFKNGTNTCTTGATGTCSVTWINSNPTIPATGLATITASSTGVTSGTGTIIMSSAQSKITENCTTAMPAPYPATQSCTVMVTDLLGHAMGNGATGTISVTNGTGAYAVSPTTFAVTSGSGITLVPIVVTKTAAGTGTLSATTTSSGIITTYTRANFTD